MHLLWSHHSVAAEQSHKTNWSLDATGEKVMPIPKGRSRWWLLDGVGHLNSSGRGEITNNNLRNLDSCWGTGSAAILKRTNRTRLGPNWTCGFYWILGHGKETQRPTDPQAHGFDVVNGWIQVLDLNHDCFWKFLRWMILNFSCWLFCEMNHNSWIMIHES